MNRTPAACAVTMAACSLAASALASPDARDTGAGQNHRRMRESNSRSFGWPWRGTLLHGVKLEPSELLRYAKGDAEDGHFYGTRELVGVIQRALKAVQREAPGGAPLPLGELSRRSGGDIVGHRSHENGRDADVGFFLEDDGEPVATEDFVRVNWRGRRRLDGRVVEFDAKRNWLFVKALMLDSRVTVQHVFVARRIRRLLLREARRRGADPALRERAEHVILPPGVRHPHRNHYHIRIYCPADDLPGCRDKGPFWPWLPAEHPFSERPSPQFAHIDTGD